MSATMSIAIEHTTDSTDSDFIASVAKELEFTVSSYSGRGMMGKNCIGVYVENLTDIGRIMFHLGALNQDENVNMTQQVFDWRYDNAGKGYVVYWPKVAPYEEPCPPCPECKSYETEYAHMDAEQMGVETYYKVCLNCSHTWDPE